MILFFFIFVRWISKIFLFFLLHHNRSYLIIIIDIREKNACAFVFIESTTFRTKIVCIVTFFFVALRNVSVRRVFDRLWICLIHSLHAFLTCLIQFIVHSIIKVFFCNIQCRIQVRVMFSNAFALVFALIKRSIVTKLFWVHVNFNEVRHDLMYVEDIKK